MSWALGSFYESWMKSVSEKDNRVPIAFGEARTYCLMFAVNCNASILLNFFMSF